LTEFPTLTTQPDVAGWSEERAFDPTIRARSEGGYVKTRARTTRVPMQWKLVYAGLSAADKATLQNFEAEVGIGADAFTWTNPADASSHTVRLTAPIKFSPVSPSLYWRAEFAVEQV
jgi:hypothetical protein